MATMEKNFKTFAENKTSTIMKGKQKTNLLAEICDVDIL